MGKGSGQNESRASILGSINSGSNFPIRLSFPSEDEFYHQKSGDYTLIHPRKAKWTWSNEERPYRSVILDADGKVLSSGFPKFGNFGENGYEDHHQHLVQDLNSSNKIWMTEKMDGSLAIRSVIDGKVIWRTRGSWDGGDFGLAMQRVAAQKYPDLLDPELYPESSLLFEFISPNPDFKVVITYHEEDLVLIGKVNHHDLHLADDAELHSLSSHHSLKVVQTLDLPTDLEELVQVVGDWEGQEGIVIRCNNSQSLIKIKSQSYLKLHRLKSHLSAKNIFVRCEEEEISSFEQFSNSIYDLGGDWEMTQSAKPFVENYLQIREQTDQQLKDLSLWVAQKSAGTDRKTFAVEHVPSLPSHQRSAAFALLDGETKETQELLYSQLKDQMIKELKNVYDQAEILDQ